MPTPNPQPLDPRDAVLQMMRGVLLIAAFTAAGLIPPQLPDPLRRPLLVLTVLLLLLYALPAHFARGYSVRTWNRRLVAWGGSAAATGLALIHLTGPDMPSWLDGITLFYAGAGALFIAVIRAATRD